MKEIIYLMKFFFLIHLISYLCYQLFPWHVFSEFLLATRDETEVQ